MPISAGRFDPWAGSWRDQDEFAFSEDETKIARDIRVDNIDFDARRRGSETERFVVKRKAFELAEMRRSRPGNALEGIRPSGCPYGILYALATARFAVRRGRHFIREPRPLVRARSLLVHGNDVALRSA
jgi:hypothetical protein